MLSMAPTAYSIHWDLKAEAWLIFFWSKIISEFLTSFSSMNSFSPGKNHWNVWGIHEAYWSLVFCPCSVHMHFSDRNLVQSKLGLVLAGTVSRNISFLGFCFGVCSNLLMGSSADWFTESLRSSTLTF
jgi:hypothetical protein